MNEVNFGTWENRNLITSSPSNFYYEKRRIAHDWTVLESNK